MKKFLITLVILSSFSPTLYASEEGFACIQQIQQNGKPAKPKYTPYMILHGSSLINVMMRDPKAYKHSNKAKYVYDHNYLIINRTKDGDYSSFDLGKNRVLDKNSIAIYKDQKNRQYKIRRELYKNDCGYWK